MINQNKNLKPTKHPKRYIEPDTKNAKVCGNKIHHLANTIISSLAVLSNQGNHVTCDQEKNLVGSNS